MAFLAGNEAPGRRDRWAATGFALVLAASAVVAGPRFAEANDIGLREAAPAALLASATDLSAPAPSLAASTCVDAEPQTASAGLRPATRLSVAAASSLTDDFECGRASTQRSTTQAACGVSQLLVPSCGAWLGAATTDAALAYDYRTGLAEYELASSNEPDIQHFYRAGGGPFPTPTQRSLAERPGHERSLLLINWKPSTSLTWKQIANGAADADIASAAAGMRTYPHKFFLTIWHEPENDFGPGRQPSDYVAMYRHVVTELRSLGVVNVVYVWNMMGYSGHGYLYDQLYPGSDFVDWIAWDPYSTKGSSMAQLVNENCCNVRNWTGFYDWATRTAPGKPLMLAEWGFDLIKNPNGPAALDGGTEILRTRFPELKALVYWNENRQGQYRIDTETPIGRAYGQSYRRFASDPYFNSTSRSAAP